MENDKVRQFPSPKHMYESLASYGGGGDNTGMEQRVTRLETHFEYVQKDIGEIKKDIGEIKSDLSAIKDRLKALPTINGFWGMIATVLGVSLTMIGAVVGVVAVVAR
jgi:hypothetical protein